MAVVEPCPYLLANRIQHYAWGTRGKDAFIPRLLGVEAEADRPYAELWMGTHPNASSDVVMPGGGVTSLRRLIEQAPVEILGAAAAERFGSALPFLFKVLSAEEALSIQVHPNKEQARILHARDPLHYLDDNHKPEVAVALDSLAALVGFKPLAGIAQTLAVYPELAAFIGEDVARQVKDASGPSALEGRDLVRLAYATLVKRSASHERELLEAIAQLRRRLSPQPGLSEVEQLFLDLCASYAGPDVGLFSIFFLNLVHLDKGQGIFLKAGVPHAYLKGNIVECMANSDNVVRVGLTRKFKDPATLVDVLDYEPGPVPILEGVGGAEEFVYPVPVAEFQLARWRLTPGRQRHETSGVRVLLLTEGEVLMRWAAGARAFRRGQSVLIPACLSQFTLQASTPAEVFQASVPV